MFHCNCLFQRKLIYLQPYKQVCCVWCAVRVHPAMAPSLGDRMLQTVQRLLSAAPKLVNAKDSHGATPLMYAAMKGSVQVGSQRKLYC